MNCIRHTDSVTCYPGTRRRIVSGVAIQWSRLVVVQPAARDHDFAAERRPSTRSSAGVFIGPPPKSWLFENQVIPEDRSATIFERVVVTSVVEAVQAEAGGEKPRFDAGCLELGLLFVDGPADHDRHLGVLRHQSDQTFHGEAAQVPRNVHPDRAQQQYIELLGRVVGEHQVGKMRGNPGNTGVREFLLRRVQGVRPGLDGRDLKAETRETGGVAPSPLPTSRAFCPAFRKPTSG